MLEAMIAGLCAVQVQWQPAAFLLQQLLQIRQCQQAMWAAD
jgi:hypothetical protein